MTPLLILTLLATPSSGITESGTRGSLPGSSCEVRKLPGCVHDLRSGDLILFKTGNVVSNLLCHLVLCGGVTHTGIVVARPDGGLVLLETPTVGARVALSDIGPRLESYKGTVWVRRRCAALTPEQSHQLTAFAWTQAGKKYDYLGLFLMPVQLPVRIFCKRCPDPKAEQPSRWFCSSLVLAACAEAGLVDPCKVRPDGAAPVDFKLDLFLDLSHGWHTPEMLPRVPTGCR
jgi:hypothetical protein